MASITEGVLTALITPFDPRNLEVDWHAYERVLEIQKKGRVHGVVICGTTGEAPTLTSDEKKKLIEKAVQFFKGSGVQVFAGTGTYNTKETVDFSAWASDAGVDGVLVVTPYYNRPTQEGLKQHYLKIADAINCELMLYNIPGRTAVSLEFETIEALAGHPNIRSIKDGSGGIDLARQAQQVMDTFAGDDSNFYSFLDIGGKGVVSVASNIIPDVLVRIYSLFREGRKEEAKALHGKHQGFFKGLFLESNPSPVKWLLAQEYSWLSSAVRLPLVPLSEKYQSQLLDLRRSL